MNVQIFSDVHGDVHPIKPITILPGVDWDRRRGYLRERDPRLRVPSSHRATAHLDRHGARQPRILPPLRSRVTRRRPFPGGFLEHSIYWKTRP